MKERPILFSGEMVRAILDGTKTMTLRAVKLDEFGPSDTPGYDFTFRKHGLLHDVRMADMLNPPRRNYPGACPYGTAGDRLWVRETHAFHPQDQTTVFYRATVDTEPGIRVWDGPWISPARMPRWASRITLEITDIRVERLRDITRDDAMEEGVERVDPYSITPDLPPGMPACWKDYAGNGWLASPIESFRTLWDSINAKRHPWASNPWVWVIEFRRAK